MGMTTKTWLADPATDAQKNMLRKIAARKMSVEAMVAEEERITNATKGEVDSLKNFYFALPWPKKEAPAVPNGRYAIKLETQDKLHFYRVKAGYKAGVFFVDEQASDEFFPVHNAKHRAEILAEIAKDPEAAGLKYAEEIGQCRRCGRVLTDENNPYKDQGYGPDCGGKI